MIIILEGISGVGKSTVSKKLKDSLENEFKDQKIQCEIIAHPSFNTLYGNLSRKLINLKNKVNTSWLANFLDIFIGFCAIKDFKHSLKLAKANPEKIYIWERSPLSSIVYNATSKLAANLIADGILNLEFPPETKWVLFTHIDFNLHLQRLKERKRDDSDLNPNRSKLISENKTFQELQQLLSTERVTLNHSFLSKEMNFYSSPDDKVKAIMHFIRSTDKYSFFNHVN